jgi:hypothetical protein
MQTLRKQFTLEKMLDLTVSGHRKESFEKMIAHLKTIDNPLIVETGCSRQLDNWGGDGMSTVIFDKYINEYGGEFNAVDINLDNVKMAQSLVSDKTTVHCSDSVSWLWNFNKLGKKIDLLYLDSFDFDQHNPGPSMCHHLFELTAIRPSLKKGTMIAVDDNFGYFGKGMLVKHFMEHIGNPIVHTGYQLIWIWNE